MLVEWAGTDSLTWEELPNLYYCAKLLEIFCQLYFTKLNAANTQEISILNQL